METDLLDAKQKTEFYRDKMQELVRENGPSKRTWVAGWSFGVQLWMVTGWLS
jgi:hypothetical protein